MANRAWLFAAGISTVFLFGCATTQQPVAEVRTATAKPAFAAAPKAAPPPKFAESVEYSKLEKRERAERADPAAREAMLEREAAGMPGKRFGFAAKAKKNGGSAAAAEAASRLLAERRTAVASAAAGPPELSADADLPLRRLLAERRTAVASAAAASPEFSADADLLARRDAYHQQLKQAAYTFNPLSPIKVATPVTVYFWIDPIAEPLRLAEELQAKLLAMRPGEAPRTEAGRIDWSPKMRATLTGDDFDIAPTEGKGFDGQKNLSATRRTEWAWDIKAKRVGETLPLHLQVWAVLPKELGEPYEVLKLDKLIHVEVTLFWLLDEYWEKYWKWILGGLGTALATAIGAWWKSRQTKTASG